MAIQETDEALSSFLTGIRKPAVKQAVLFYHLRDMLLSQKVYLSAMYDYVRQGGGSRGSALYSCADGSKPGAAMEVPL